MKETVSLIIEIAVIVSLIVFFSTLVGVYVYKKKHYLPIGECSDCHKRTSRLLKEYHALYSKKK